MGSWSVHLTTNKDQIQAFLRRDPVYAAYAIGDLEPEHFPFCTWYLAEASKQPSALALLYRRLEPPVLLTMGETTGIAAIFDEVALPQHVYMAALGAHLQVFEAHYDFSGDRIRPMLRMNLAPEACQTVCKLPANATPRRLSSADVPAIEALYAAGGPFAPDAFSPSQVAEGTFFGLEGQALGHMKRGPLIAVAGTHLVAPTMGVAAVGNIYTHPAQRGKGYGQLVTSAVTEDLLKRNLLVVLNVDESNTAAVHLYEKLGYRVHCPFVEGGGRRRTADGGQRSEVRGQGLPPAVAGLPSAVVGLPSAVNDQQTCQNRYQLT